MKKYYLIIVALAAIMMSSCNETPFINNPGTVPSYASYTLTDEPQILIPDTNGTIVTVDEAVAIANGLKNDQVTPEQYKVVGTIVNILTDVSTVPNKYTNINMEISDGGQQVLQCYYTNNVNNIPFYKRESVPAVGTKVTVQGALTKYNGKPEMKNGFIVRIHEQN